MKSLLNEFSCKGNIFIYFTEELYQLKNGRLLAMTDYRSPFKKFVCHENSLTIYYFHERSQYDKNCSPFNLIHFCLGSS